MDYGLLFGFGGGTGKGPGIGRSHDHQTPRICGCTELAHDHIQEKAPWGRGCCYTLYTVVMYSPNAYQFRGVCHSYENKRLLSIKRLLLGLLGRLLNH